MKNGCYLSCGKVKCLVAILIIFVFCFATALADPFNSYGYPNSHIVVRNYGSNYNSNWVNYLDYGMYAWNSSTSHVVISRNSSTSTNIVEAANYNDTWYGLTTQYRDTYGKINRFTIKVNATTIWDDSTNFANFAKSVVVHEYGHVMWLCDNPTTSSSSIMKYTRNRNTMYNPQAFDITNVNLKY